ncbi:extracellular superoxide dismutase [Cu-Zn]-like [Scyliorhinus canicula]|uniref:extracellular superoxide dismutase [Cu-Zn]-like n=1 Tax=Scyliorhinus canicula TaxID=7830 RepID=UPI0018F369E4|nr:extracellular superoxide dismutase [Cu-Zn]-like [Scyliorhinus canicula]
MASDTDCQPSPGTLGSLTASGIGGIYSSALQLLLMTGILALQVPQAVGQYESKIIGGVSDRFKAMLLKMRSLPPCGSSQERFAVCRMQPSADLAAGLPSVRGTVLFRQSSSADKLQAYFHLSGFPRDAEQPRRAIHVHQFGKLSGGCSSTGPHYNPRNVNHPHHPGDFNNFQVRQGTIVQHLRDLRAELYGAESIVGRGLVIHEHEDDLGRGGNPGSLQSGNSGRRLACCIITLTNGRLWKETVPDA